MGKRLDETLGTVEYDGLIVDNVPVADVVSVKLAASQGVLARGSLVTGTAGGDLAIVAEALVGTNATYVLADDVDTGTGSAVGATAYRVGHFATNKLITKSYELVAADKEILRDAGILVSDALEV